MIGVTAGMLKTPAQIFVAVAISTILYTVRAPYYGLKARGLWTVITAVMVLESSFGATVKKARGGARFRRHASPPPHLS